MSLNPKHQTSGHNMLCSLIDPHTGSAALHCFDHADICITDTKGNPHAVCVRHALMFMAYWHPRELRSKTRDRHPEWIGIPEAREWKFHTARVPKPELFGFQAVFDFSTQSGNVVRDPENPDYVNRWKVVPIDLSHDNIRFDLLHAFEKSRDQFCSKMLAQKIIAAPIAEGVRAGLIPIVQPKWKDEKFWTRYQKEH